MNLDIHPLVAAFCAAITFGLADFLGGRAGHRIGAAAAVAIVQTVAAVMAIAIIGLGGYPLPHGRDLMLGIIAGLTDGIALLLLYRGLAEGRIGIVAPLASLISVAVPATAEAVWIVVPPPVQLIGMALATIAVVVIGRVVDEDSDAAKTRLSIVLGASCGLAFGVTNLTLGLVQPDYGNGALLVMRIVAALIAFGFLLSSRNRPAVTAAGVGIAGLAGILDGIGLTSYVFAATHGLIGVAASVLALYAGVTIVLGVLVLKERVSPMQMVGLGIGAVSAVLLSAGGS